LCEYKNKIVEIPIFDYNVFFFLIKELWKDRIRVKFQNSRKRVDGNLPEIVQKKKKKSKEDSEVNHTSGSAMWGMTNYHPEKPESEDLQSAENQMKWMQAEIRRKDVDDVGISRRMDLTMWHRRQIIVDEKKSIKEILLMYPALASVKQVFMIENKQSWSSSMWSEFCFVCLFIYYLFTWMRGLSVLFLKVRGHDSRPDLNLPGRLEMKRLGWIPLKCVFLY
jgi:hypothetical protein